MMRRVVMLFWTAPAALPLPELLEPVGDGVCILRWYVCMYICMYERGRIEIKIDR